MPKKEIYQYPPYLYLEQVLDHCPKAGKTYMQLWQNMDRNNKLSISKEDIRTEYLTQVATFRHNLLLLVKEGLASIDETPSFIYVELTDWQFDAEGCPLC
jgi:hypothetical protein